MQGEKSDKVDYHIHTNFSDSEAPLSRLVNEAYAAGVNEIGFCDHANLLDPEKNYSANFEYPGYDSHNFDHISRVFDIFHTREYALIEEALDNEACILTDSFDYDVLPDRVTDPDAVEADPVKVYSGIELDYNPPIEVVLERAETQVAENYNRDLQSILDFAEYMPLEFVVNVEGQSRPFIKNGLSFDVKLGSVHDVRIGDNLLYVKRDDEFADLTLSDRQEAIDLYFKKLEHLVDSEIYDFCAHPSLIERNDVLMDAMPFNGFRSRKDQLRDYYSSLINSINASNTIPEFNGKGVERQRPESVFWDLVKNKDVLHTRGSDAHRLGEISSRINDFERVEEGKAPSTPSDTKMLKKKKRNYR